MRFLCRFILNKVFNDKYRVIHTWTLHREITLVVLKWDSIAKHNFDVTRTSIRKCAFINEAVHRKRDKLGKNTKLEIMPSL